MEFSKTVEDAINKQIKEELYSSYLYLSMSAYCESIDFRGVAFWLRKQSQEEYSHAMKFFDYIYDRQGRVTLQAIEQPPTEFGTLVNIFQKVLEHEQKVTGLIHEIYKLAVGENDYATQVALHWFIEEQVEEEKTANEILAQLAMVGDNKAALLMFDKQLGAK